MEKAEVGALPRNFMRACILLWLSNNPAHGYDLLERFRTWELEVDPGGLYRNLRLMEHVGLLSSSWEASASGPDRRRYELTAAGSDELETWVERLTRMSLVLDAFLARHRGGFPGATQGR